MRPSITNEKRSKIEVSRNEKIAKSVSAQSIIDHMEGKKKIMLKVEKQPVGATYSPVNMKDYDNDYDAGLLKKTNFDKKRFTLAPNSTMHLYKGEGTQSVPSF